MLLPIEEAVEQFQYELPEEIQLTCQAPEISAAVAELEEAHHITLAPIVIYFAIGELTPDAIAPYLKSELDVDDAAAHALEREILEKIINPIKERLDFLNDDPDKPMSLQQEKNYLEQMFKTGLLRELNQSPIIASAVNRRLFSVLARDKEFHKRLEQMLYENDELVTKNNVTVDGQSIKPSVANWIKDFISHYGSQSYDSVSLSSFLINSENARHLSDEDREAVSLILKVYTNIKFFPDSMPDDETGESWQIIPYTDEAAELERVEKRAPVAPIPAKPAVQNIVPKPAAPAAAAIPASVPPEESPELLELKNMLLQYPAGSLERAAIEEEIKKMRNN